MTSDLQWVDFKSGIDNQMKEIVAKQDSYSSDSLEEYCEENSPPDIDKNKTGSYEQLDLHMSNNQCLSQTTSEINSVNDTTSITSIYSLETVEETESLQTENITESVDIRISPCNSTVMSLNCSNNFYSEFSLVANVEVQIPEGKENTENAKDSVEPDLEHPVETMFKDEDELHNEGESSNVKEFDINVHAQEMLSSNINTNNNINMKVMEQLKEDFIHERATQQKQLDIKTDLALKKTEYYANKIEITTKQEKSISETTKQEKSISETTKQEKSISETTKQEKNFSSEKAKQEKKLSSLVEKKIAEEIKEMREREEDLRVMREKLIKEVSGKIAMNESTDADTSALPKSEIVACPSPDCDDKLVSSGSTTIKSDTGLIKACVFAIRRKKNLFKADNCEKNNLFPSAITHQESPVEREIRIAMEREEELKRERAEALKAKLEMESLNSEFGTNETDADSALSICSDSSFDSVSKLNASFPRNGSPEISNSNGISVYSSSAGSICSLDSLSQRHALGSQSLGGSLNGFLVSPSPDSASVKPAYPFSTPRTSADKRNKNIDMERFIASKGKEIQFRKDTGIYEHRSYELKPPQVKKGEETTCKRFITAATKIQKELKEMQEREEQFKKERATLQKDGNNGIDTKENGISPQEKNFVDSHTLPPTKVKNSDFPEEFESLKQENLITTRRRRSILIDEWEQRIHKSN